MYDSPELFEASLSLLRTNSQRPALVKVLDDVQLLEEALPPPFPKFANLERELDYLRYHVESYETWAICSPRRPDVDVDVLEHVLVTLQHLAEFCNQPLKHSRVPDVHDDDDGGDARARDAFAAVRRRRRRGPARADPRRRREGGLRGGVRGRRRVDGRRRREEGRRRVQAVEGVAGCAQPRRRGAALVRSAHPVRGVPRGPAQAARERDAERGGRGRDARARAAARLERERWRARHTRRCARSCTRRGTACSAGCAATGTTRRLFERLDHVRAEMDPSSASRAVVEIFRDNARNIELPARAVPLFARLLNEHHDKAAKSQSAGEAPRPRAK